MHVPSLLIVDDDAADRYILRRELETIEYGGCVYENTDGEQALNFLKDYSNNKLLSGDCFPPHCIFLDINMPRVNGFEFLEIFRELREQNNDYHTASIVIITSSERKNDIDKALSFPGVKSYFVKGKYDLEDLRQAVTANLAVK